jgi:hypothetical protein
MLTRPTCRPGWRLARLALATLVVAWASAAVAQPPPVTRLTCGGFDAVPSGADSSGRPTRLSIQQKGRLMVTVSDWAILRVDCADFNNDKTFELLVSSYSGGAHCCETVHVWALEKKPRKLLEYAAGNAGGFELKDLDGDGRQELLLGDDSFAYFGDLCYACSPSQLPLVACSGDRGFQDCTRKFPDVLNAALERSAQRLMPPDDDTDTKFVEGAALGTLALWSLLGDEEKGLQVIRLAVKSDDVMKWLERARPQVRDWMAARGKRLKDGQ